MEAFSSKTGISSSSLCRIENEEQNVSLDTLEHLCQVFRCNIGDLFVE